MTFYTDLRDDVAGPLIADKGATATLRQTTAGGVYDPTTGAVSAKTPTDTVFSYVDLPISRQRLRAYFRDEMVEKVEKLFLVSAVEFAAASVSPGVDDVILISGVSYRILGIAPVAPGTVPVVYRIGAMRA